MKRTLLLAAAVAVASLAWGEIAVKKGERVAFLGDSITQFGNYNDGGYVRLVMLGLELCGVQAEKIPAGVSGNKSNQMLARLQRDVLDRKPDWMVLSCGVNDVGHGRNGVELEPYKTNITAIVDRCRDAGVKVIVATPTLCTDVDWQKSGSNRKLEGYCTFLRQLAAERKLPLADLNRDERTLLASAACPKAGLTFDHLHMNGYGNVMMAKGILRAMGVDDAQLARCESIWRRSVRGMQPFGMHWANWNESDRQIPIDVYEEIERKATAAGRSVKDYLMDRICELGRPQAPSGSEWEDPTALHFGKERPCAAFASFATVEEAKAIRPECCSRRICLDSETEWRFNWCRRPEERPVDFYKPSFDVSGWDVVKVPCSWQAMGIRKDGKPYDRVYYTNANWPFVPKFPANSNCWPRVRGHRLPEGFTLGSDENPVGSYRRDFEVPADWTGDEVYLEFGAVDSFFYLWVNGRYVGFSKSSRDPARFNVTEFVRSGRNTVALEVYRFSDASYLEAQDMLLLSGLARSVWLFRTPKTHLRDAAFVTRPAKRGDYAGAWKLDIRTEVVGGKAEVVPHVFGADGAELPFPKDGVFAAPKLWSAECPNLYTLVLELRRGGRTLEAAGFQLGFREVEIRDAKDQRDRTFLLNGQPIKMRGANRHETSPLYGHYTPDALIELDVRQLKQANCNHVRNAHYPQPDYFYYLCNKYGIYVMDEANLESHGFFYGKESLSHFRVWEAAHVDRVVNMVERNKCHPCVVIWSMANEAGPGSNFVSCVAAARKADPSRPVQYERNNWITDMGSRQYPEVQWVWDCANGKEGLHHEPSNRPLRYPFHINEYAHNMGNAMGNLKDYQDAIESTTRIMGSAIWDWVDQGLWKEVKRKSEKGKGEGKDEETVRILAYGGDWGEKPTCGAFMMNGCVLSDRTPEPGYWEIKHVFQPIVVERDGDGIRVTNRHYFRDLSAYDCVLTRLVDGEAVSEQTLDLALGPRASKTLAVEPTGSYRIAFRQKAAEGLWPKGWTIADDQVDFTAPSAACAQPKGKLTFGFCQKSGELVSLTSGTLVKTELLKEPLTLDIWRAPSQNEPREKKIWAEKGFAAPKRTLVSFSDTTDAQGVRTVDSVVDYAVTGTTFRVATVWTIRDGAAKVKATFTQTGAKAEPAHVGFRTVFAEKSTDVDWLGCGPWENYSDRRSGAFLGKWSLASADFFVPYDVPQDCGNREGTYRVALAGVTFETLGAPFAFEVNPYAPETLVRYAHPAELPPSDSTFFGLYAKSRGVGNNSCGPLPLAKDVVKEGPYTLEFIIR